MSTEYQQTLMSQFIEHKEHDAVKYATSLLLGYDAVFKFSVHIQKAGEQFVFIDDIGSLVEDGRWTRQSATDFLELLNKFYTEIGFAAFYQSNIDFYETETQRQVSGIIEILYYYKITQFLIKDIKDFYVKLKILNPRSDGIRKPSTRQIVNALEKMSNIQFAGDETYNIVEADITIFAKEIMTYDEKRIV